MRFLEKKAFRKRRRDYETYTYINNKKKKKKKRGVALSRQSEKKAREREKKNQLCLLHRLSAVKIIYYLLRHVVYKIKDRRLSLLFLRVSKNIIFFLPDILLAR